MIDYFKNLIYHMKTWIRIYRVIIDVIKYVKFLIVEIIYYKLEKPDS